MKLCSVPMPDALKLTSLRAVLSPPRPPTSWVGFNAVA